MVFPNYNSLYLVTKVYNIFMTCGQKQRVETMFFSVFKQLRLKTKLKACSLFFFFQFFTYLRCSIELLSKKKGRRWYYAPFVVTPQRQINASFRLVKRHLYASVGWLERPFITVLFTSMKEFFNIKKKSYFKDYKVRYIKKVIYSRIYKRYR